MTLHADFHLAHGSQSRRIDDGIRDGLPAGAFTLCGLNVAAARPVASLAINSLRQDAAEERFRSKLVVSFGYVRIGVVTKHALQADPASRVGLIRLVVTRIHRPIPTVFRIPCERELEERARAGPVQVGADVISGA